MLKTFSAAVIAVLTLSLARVATPFQDNLNIRPYNGLHDSVGVTLYGNYFLYGSGPLDLRFYQAQVAESDINGDGVPLSVADYVCLFREQIRRDTVLGNGLDMPQLAPPGGYFGLAVSPKRSYVGVRAKTVEHLGAALFVFRCRDTEIDSVVSVGKASDFTVKYCAEKGTLRVLITAPIRPGRPTRVSGEILRIVSRASKGTIELQAVNAATYNCRIIEPAYGVRRVTF